MHRQPLHCLQPAVAQCAAIARDDVVAQPHKAGIGLQPRASWLLILQIDALATGSSLMSAAACWAKQQCYHCGGDLMVRNSQSADRSLRPKPDSRLFFCS